MNLEQHLSTLHAAMSACAERTFFAHWPEPPSGKIYGENANAEGEQAFKQSLQKPFQGLLQKGEGSVGEEVSPWGFPLGITYPASSPDAFVQQAVSAQSLWQRLPVRDRAVLLIEALERASKRFFEIGYATMHTTGQGFVMAFQSSGPHAFDRALEAVAMGVIAQEMCTTPVEWVKPMGKVNVSINKSYVCRPKGVNLVIGCSTFPVWNSLPGLFAGLITGNSVIVKPHPSAVLPIAIIVAELQATLQLHGYDPHLVQLAADSASRPITMAFVEHPEVRIIDYTGGSVFGTAVEAAALPQGKVVYSEKAGVNSVIIESADDLDKALSNVAFSLSLYSGQMCTAPQNIFIPQQGVSAGGVHYTVDQVVTKLVECIDALVGNEKTGPGTVGTIQNTATLQRVEEARALGLEVIRDSGSVPQHGFEHARTASPLILKAGPNNEALYTREWFGPISFVITTESFQEAVAVVAKSVRDHGALTVSVYTTNADYQQMAEDAIVSAGAPVAFNFDSFVWVNQSAAFSDYHGTGANPAGTASFTDLSFVSGRYNIIGVRKQATQQ